ncbi:MAG: AIR synthase-related protein, partial [Acidilobaceae archaeon]
VLNSSFDARIDAPRPPSIFEVIQELGRISTEEMYKVFNMGIGMIVITEREALDDLIGLAERHGLKASSIGVLEKGIGRVLIKTWRGEKIEI